MRRLVQIAYQVVGKNTLTLFIALGLSLLFVSNAEAGLTLSIDSRSVFFGRMDLGEEKELADYGEYHNEVICNSTNNKTWYLKIHLLRPLTYEEYTIPAENFKWQVNYTDGVGTIVNEYRFTTFSLTPSTVYISGSGEANNKDVKFQFKYKLTIPDKQLTGTYNTVIRYTMTEIL